MNIPDNLKYTSLHLWVDIDGDEATVGLTDFAQDQMGDILFVDLPSAGDSFSAGETFSEVESSKSAQELTLPFDSEVIEANEELDDSPENINSDPYGAWIVKVRIVGDVDGLMDCDEYGGFCTEE